MPILAVGLSHQEAPVEVREQLAIPASRSDDALELLAEHTPNGIILSTCNRTEVYAIVGHRDSGQRTLTHFLAEASGLDEHELSGHLSSYWQEEAIRHIFRVAAGLDSMILGEGQILGQVREACERASRRQPVGPILARLFDRALVVGKRARTETAIARSAVSISQAAVELARESLGGLRESTVLVVGAGKMGGLAARALRERGAGRVLVTNRTDGRSHALVDQLGGEAWPFEALDDGLTRADIVISSTASEGYVITTDRLAGVLSRRQQRPLAIVDIAVPRDVEPSASELEGVHLFNIDDLRSVCASGLDLRRQEVEKVELIVEDELEKYIRWWEARELAPTISELVRKAETIRQEEMSRALGRLGTLSEREANAVNALTQAIVNKMLHAPIVRLKERGSGLDGKHYLHAVRELFDLPAPELAAD
jgi:glutamyl-tRNA reductase